MNKQFQPHSGQCYFVTHLFRGRIKIVVMDTIGPLIIAKVYGKTQAQWLNKGLISKMEPATTSKYRQL